MPSLVAQGGETFHILFGGIPALDFDTLQYGFLFILGFCEGFISLITDLFNFVELVDDQLSGVIDFFYYVGDIAYFRFIEPIVGVEQGFTGFDQIFVQDPAGSRVFDHAANAGDI